MNTALSEISKRFLEEHLESEQAIESFIYFLEDGEALENAGYSNTHEYEIEHLHNACSDSSSNGSYLLLKVANTAESFEALLNAYESLYSKIRDYKDFVQSKESPSFKPTEFFNTLSENELNLFKFTLFCNTSDKHIFSDLTCECCMHSIDELKKDAFMSFGISDSQINSIFQHLKMNPEYFHSRFRVGKKPSVYYFEPGEGVRSYLNPEDELILWRTNKKYSDYLSSNFKFIQDMNEPEDRG